MEIEDIVESLENSTSFNGFRQLIMHLQDKLTDTDIAIHARQLCRKKMKDPTDKIAFDFKGHKEALEGLNYSEFQEVTEED